MSLASCCHQYEMKIIQNIKQLQGMGRKMKENARDKGGKVLRKE